MNIKELRTIEKIELCKINKKVIGEIPLMFLKNETCKFSEIATIDIEISKIFQDNHTPKQTELLIYNDIKNERFIRINEEDYYVIKEIKEDRINKVKTIKAYSYEKKLEKNNIFLSDMMLSLMDNDIENNIYSFNDELYKSTGWKLGHIDYTVRYKDNGEIKVRMQESTNMSFYQFIIEVIQEQFCCIADFDIKNKLINLYDEDSFGDKVKVVLHKDNYIKSLEKTFNTNPLVTQLTLQGNDEKCIVEDVNPNGKNYIEDFSYFIETDEMSEELINALNIYDKLTEKRVEEWRSLNTKKINLSTEISNKTSNENILMAMVKEYENYIIAHQNIEEEGIEYDLTDFENQLAIKRDELSDLNKSLTNLEQQLENINNRIKELNILIRKETALDNKGNLIFNNDLLDELKEFIYNDTYSEDSFLDANELINTGKHLLKNKCKPTIEYSINVNDFTSRIISNKTPSTWNDELSMGDLIILYDKETKKEEYVYFVGWEKRYTYKKETGVLESELTLDLSNKKTNKTNTKVINDLLKDAKNTKKQVNSTKHILNNQKYNRFESNLLSNEDITLDLEPPKFNDMTQVTGIDLNISDLVLDINNSKQIKALIKPSTAKNQNVIWTSSDNNIATVSTTGVVKAINYGSCKITAITEEGNYTAVCELLVQKSEDKNEINVTGIQLNNSNISLDINEEEYISPIILPNNATNQNVTYISSSPNIATVNNEGLVTGVNYGVCEIKVIPTGNIDISARCFVSVSTENKKDIPTLTNALVLGEGRIAEMNRLGMFNKLYVDAKTDVGIDYYMNNIKTYPVNPTCIIIMLGVNDLSSEGALDIKNLISNLKNKYPTKNIYLINALPVGVAYQSDKLYSEVNNNISKFNSMIRDYANLMNAKVINPNMLLVSSGTLNSYYTTNGYYLTNNGYKILYNNITNNILSHLNSNNTTNDSDEDNTSNDTNITLSKQRQLIVNRAEEIVKMCKEGKAWYSQYNRTIDWNNKQTIKSSYETITSQDVKKTYKQPGVGKIGFDCSSFVGVCYQNAGYDFMKGKSCAGGTLQEMAKKHNAKAWRYIDTKFEKALPGDIVMFANDKVKLTKDNMFTVRTHHTAIYMGNGYIAEAIGYSSGIQKRKRTTSDRWFFFRIEELTESDKKANNSNSSSNSNSSNNTSIPNCYDITGSINGYNYIYKFTKARCTCYGGTNLTGAGGKLQIGKTCGAHNMPYGTKLYIPALKGQKAIDTNGNKITMDGIITVKDTGGYTTDFDILMGRTNNEAMNLLGNPLCTDVYVLEWGTGKTAWSFTEAIEWCNGYYGVGHFHTSWTYYMKYGGCTINFWKFKDDDKTIKSKSWYNKL